MKLDLGWLFMRNRLEMLKKISECERKENGCCYLNHVVKDFEMSMVQSLHIFKQMKDAGITVSQKTGRKNLIKLTDRGKEILKLLVSMEAVK